MSHIEDIRQDISELREKVEDKFNPKKIVFMEVQPGINNHEIAIILIKLMISFQKFENSPGQNIK